jgi:hypothetical protein
MTDDITLPTKPSGEFVSYCDSYSDGAWRAFDAQDMESYARAAVLLDRQQRAAPSAEPFSPKEIVLMNEKWLHRKALGLAEAAPSAEPVNLNDPAVQKRLAAQWGYVPAPSAEPVGHLHSNGDFCWKRSIAPELWPVPLYEAPPAPSAEPPDHTAAMRMALDALNDMSNGWRYIRETHGDLYGVGWDRPENKASAAIDALRAALEEKR